MAPGSEDGRRRFGLQANEDENNLGNKKSKKLLNESAN